MGNYKSKILIFCNKIGNVFQIFSFSYLYISYLFIARTCLVLMTGQAKRSVWERRPIVTLRCRTMVLWYDPWPLKYWDKFVKPYFFLQNNFPFFNFCYYFHCRSITDMEGDTNPLSLLVVFSVFKMPAVFKKTFYWTESSTVTLCMCIGSQLYLLFIAWSNVIREKAPFPRYKIGRVKRFGHR